MPCGNVAVRINPSTYFRVIVPALEIIQASFGIVVISPIPKRVYVGEVAGGSEDSAPCVIGVGRDFRTGCGYDLENIPLEILDVEVFGVSAIRGSGEAYDLSGGIIVEVQGIGVGYVRRKLRTLPDIAVSHAVDGLACAQTGLVIGKAQCVAALGHGGQLPAALPSHSPAAVAQGVAYAVVCDRFAVVRGQQVAPLGVAVGIGSSCSAAADCAAAGTGVLRPAEYIAAVVVGVVPLADEGQRFAVRGCDALVPICHIAFLTYIYIDKCVGLHFTVSAATHEFHW